MGETESAPRADRLSLSRSERGAVQYCIQSSARRAPGICGRTGFVGWRRFRLAGHAMEGTAMTRREATAIGTKLALRHGASAGMAVLRSHRAALGLAMAANAATAAILAQIGKGLSILFAAAAPMRAPTTPVMSSLETADLSAPEG